MKRLALCGIVFLCLILPFGVSAATFDNVVAFGDSLTDDGNVYAETGGATPLSPPYFYGRFSNGPVWVEYLAYQLGANLDNWAYGGATTGFNNILPYGLNTQVGNFLADNSTLPQNALYTVWAGGNDLRAISNPADAATVINTAVANISTALGNLAGAGAGDILVLNMPALGLTPEVNGNPAAAAAATAISEAFNDALSGALVLFESSYFGNLFTLDVFEIVNDVANNPGAYGFTNIEDNCLLTEGLFAHANAGDYLFWDDIHPTTKAHALLGEEAYAAVPIPSTMILLASALVGLVGVRRRFMNR